MGNSIKKKVISISCSLLISISFAIISGSLLSNNVAGFIWFISIVVFSLIIFFLLLKSSLKFVTSLLVMMIISYFIFIAIILFDTKINDSLLINKILSAKGESYYLGETRSSAIFEVIFLNIFPTILTFSSIVFVLICYKKKTFCNKLYNS